MKNYLAPSFIKFVLPLKSNAQPRIGIELTDDKQIAIGHITVQWAYLEHALFKATSQLAEEKQVIIPRDIVSFAFEKRLKALLFLFRIV